MPTSLEAIESRLKKLVDLASPTSKSYEKQVTGAVALSKVTTVSGDFPGKAWRLKQLEVTFSAAPTTSESFTVTRSSVLSDSRPLTVVFSQNPSLTSATSILKIWEDGIEMEAGDEVTMAFTNTDANTVKAVLKVEVKK